MSAQIHWPTLPPLIVPSCRSASEWPSLFVTELRLARPDLDFWVDVTVHERDGRYMATADLGEDSSDVGVRDTPQQAVQEALRCLGEPYASEMAAGSPVR